ncbi:DUF930 domain-containing protein [Phyllobacterium sp. 21LDTY02-6]|jgi:hypothetical protein|uniref:DUF930 domain-containing protein n=1 Tax=unclassified Phyllobacterium TaxID=2638441 RepID=UPI00201FBCF4|nr:MULTISPECIES: DUF930 domain-containing protein [unclassified Phyllobacterium]MCO4315759.1 DUF930 domain-containing protein [Phyllobacterium sp. 21LDTY02-6]MCX8280828.1 DUF930 domain-containing protein [Phyllobacterium sp. 0TCS1.6C]MCX8295694.1 DUF930 domain-containing protein [Phyllobacterium sp. 0TCS1.6A]
MKFASTAILCLVLTGPAFAMDNAAAQQLQKLDPQTRLEQRCDLEAMERIHKDPARLVPDELVAYAFEEPKIKGDKIRSPGAAFRSKGEWYHLSYNCATSPDHMTILSFQYSIGSVVPHDEWQHHYLVP